MLLLLLIDFISIKCETFSHDTVQASEHRASYRENTAMGTCSYNYSCRAVQLWEQVAIPQGNTAVGTCNYMAVGQYSCGDMQLYRRAVQLWEHVAIWLQGSTAVGTSSYMAVGQYSCGNMQLYGCRAVQLWEQVAIPQGSTAVGTCSYMAVGLRQHGAIRGTIHYSCGATQLSDHRAVWVYRGGGGGIEHSLVGMYNCRNTEHRAVGLYSCENNRTWKCGAVQLWEHTTVRTQSCRVIQL